MRLALLLAVIAVSSALAEPALAAPPPNDAFSNATLVTGLGGQVQSTTAEATAEAGEPAHGGFAAERSVWFRLDVPVGGEYRFDTCETTVETLVALYRGVALGALTPLAAGVANCGGPGGSVVSELAAGTYYVAVDDLEDSAGGSFTLDWRRQLRPPVAVSPPTIAGDAVEGGTLTAEPGTWASRFGPILRYTYEWRNCTGILCSQVLGTDQSIQLRSPFVGSILRVRVTAWNFDGGTTRETSSAVVRVRSPLNREPPTITGSMRVGQEVVVDYAGGWEGSQLTLTYRWQRCTSALAACVEIVGAVDETYVLTTAELGFLVRVVVTATNVAGSSTVASAALGVVRPAIRPCVVPRLRGKTLAAARKALARAGCTLGRVRRVRSKAAKGRISAQSTRQGKRLKPKARIGVVVSLGRKR